jgi:acyl carrier protein
LQSQENLLAAHIEHALAMNEAIASKLVLIFRDILDDETIVIWPNTTADDIDGWDSFSHIRLVLAVERAFKVKFSAKEINSLKDVGEFISLIKPKI